MANSGISNPGADYPKQGMSDAGNYRDEKRVLHGAGKRTTGLAGLNKRETEPGKIRNEKLMTPEKTERL
jgi:hypothetical protein